ncbi:hypothetical protein [Nakamurella leprariae]|uniref:Uncharacterized protein n=1 Tax=Nakamurella leprariae TaxID=2803911 RepID=A0A938YF10_9ACTN|nr:hypothetical protein [Nakamurella leprariae]MBM9468388.1 hypothetical protein [Nakamurella leprariae]
MSRRQARGTAEQAARRGRTRRKPVAPSRKQPPAPKGTRRTVAAVDRWTHGLRAAVILAIIGIGALVWQQWPRLTLPFSDVAPVVEALDRDSVWLDPDLPDQITGGDPAALADRIRGTIGQRPVVLVALAEDSPMAEKPLGTCTAIESRLDDVLILVSVPEDGGFAAECFGDDIGLQVDDFGFDVRIERELGYSTKYLTDDLRGQAEQLAFTYDGAVRRGDVDDRVRQYPAPARDWLIAGGITAGVVAAAAGGWWGGRRIVAAVAAARERRRRFVDLRDGLDSALSEIALLLLELGPDAPERHRRSAAEVVPEYLDLVSIVGSLRLGDDAVVPTRRIRELRRRLTAAGVGA